MYSGNKEKLDSEAGFYPEVQAQLEISFPWAAAQLILMNVCFVDYFYCIPCYLRILARYDAKITEKQTPLHISLNNSATRPSFKNLYILFLTKWPKMSKVCLHFQGDL